MTRQSAMLLMGFPFYGTCGPRIVERKERTIDAPATARLWRGPHATRQLGPALAPAPGVLLCGLWGHHSLPQCKSKIRGGRTVRHGAPTFGIGGEAKTKHADICESVPDSDTTPN